MISTAAIIGIAIGSIVGGTLVKIGRRRTIIIAQLIAIVGAAISMFTSMNTLTLGRLLLGIGAGIHNVAFSKMIYETIPSSVKSSFAMATNASACIGFMVVFFLGAVLPDPKDLEANKDD